MKSVLGRPLKSDLKRVRASFTLHPKWEKWLTKKSFEWKVSKSEALERLLLLANRFDTPPVSNRFPIPQNVLESLAKKFGVDRISLFGSVLTDKFNEKSDIDLLIDFSKEKKVGLFGLALLEKELSYYSKDRKLDLRTPKELSRYFRKKVVKESVPIYERK